MFHFWREFSSYFAPKNEFCWIFIAADADNGKQCKRKTTLSCITSSVRVYLFLNHSICTQARAQICRNHGTEGCLRELAVVSKGKFSTKDNLVTLLESLQPVMETMCPEQQPECNETNYWDRQSLDDGQCKGIMGSTVCLPMILWRQSLSFERFYAGKAK